MCTNENCGCGSYSGQECSSSLNNTIKNAQLSGNIKYDGPDFACAENPDLSITNGESLNSVIQKLLAKVCLLSAP